MSPRLSVEDAPSVFEISAGFWEPSLGAYTWDELDPRDVRPLLETAAALGFKHIDCRLPWSTLQPDGPNVPAGPLRRLESVLDAAADLGMRVTTALAVLTIAGDVWAPAWALTPEKSERTRVVHGSTVSWNVPRDPILDGAVVEALRRLIATAVNAFNGHEAISAWCLAPGILSVSSCREPDVFAEWVTGMVEAIGPQRQRRPCFAGIGVRDLICNPAFSADALCAEGVHLEIDLDWSPAWRRGASSDWFEFLPAYAKALGVASVVVTGAGQGGDTSAVVLDGLAAGGAAGCSAWSLSVMNTTLRRSPPFDRHPSLLDCGLLVRDSGMLSAWGGEWREMALDPPSIRCAPARIPPLDPDGRRRDPDAIAREAFELWTR